MYVVGVFIIEGWFEVEGYFGVFQDVLCWVVFLVQCGQVDLCQVFGVWNLIVCVWQVCCEEVFQENVVFVECVQQFVELWIVFFGECGDGGEEFELFGVLFYFDGKFVYYCVCFVVCGDYECVFEFSQIECFVGVYYCVVYVLSGIVYCQEWCEVCVGLGEWCVDFIRYYCSVEFFGQFCESGQVVVVVYGFGWVVWVVQQDCGCVIVEGCVDVVEIQFLMGFGVVQWYLFDFGICFFYEVVEWWVDGWCYDYLFVWLCYLMQDFYDVYVYICCVVDLCWVRFLFVVLGGEVGEGCGERGF